jgi:hypothetical protein
VQDRFEVNITELPEEIDMTSYIEPDRFQWSSTSVLCLIVRDVPGQD